MEQGKGIFPPNFVGYEVTNCPSATIYKPFPIYQICNLNVVKFKMMAKHRAKNAMNVRKSIHQNMSSNFLRTRKLFGSSGISWNRSEISCKLKSTF